MRQQVAAGEAWAVAIFATASEALDQRPDLERPINPYAVGLRPERWEEDGLYEEPGLTAAEASEHVKLSGRPGAVPV